MAEAPPRPGRSWGKKQTASLFSSELGVHGTMRLPNRKEELAHAKYIAIQNKSPDPDGAMAAAIALESAIRK
jgi:hypothetical protein